MLLNVPRDWNLQHPTLFYPSPAPSCNTSRAALPRRKHLHRPRCPWGTLQRPEDVHEFLQCLHNIFAIKTRSLNGFLREAGMDDRYGRQAAKLLNTSKPSQHHATCSRSWQCRRGLLQWQLEQRGMFEIPITWHILKHSQITVSPYSQMCERDFR